MSGGRPWNSRRKLLLRFSRLAVFQSIIPKQEQRHSQIIFKSIHGGHSTLYNEDVNFYYVVWNYHHALWSQNWTLEGRQKQNLMNCTHRILIVNRTERTQRHAVHFPSHAWIISIASTSIAPLCPQCDLDICPYHDAKEFLIRWKSVNSDFDILLKIIWHYIHIHTHSGLVLSHEKGAYPAICDNMDERQSYYAKWDKSGGEKQVLYGITYHMWNLKKITLIKKRE